MKKSFLSLFAIGALALASCSNDDIQVNNPGSESGEGDPIGYMGFTISTETSRAETGDWADGNDTNKDEVFNGGTADEYALAAHNHAHVAVFFDANGNYYGSSYLTPYDKGDDNGHSASHTNGYGASEHFYTYITRWRNADQKTLPSQVVVLINENPTQVEALKAEWDEKGTTLASLLARENTSGGIFNYAGTTFFTMSNSVYYDNDKLVNATQIENGKICATVEAALANRVTVYVERLVAKHTLTYGADATYVGTGGVLLQPSEDNKKKIKAVSSYTGNEEDLDWPKVTDTEWGAYLVGWNMNGLNQNNEYTFKKLNGTSYWTGGFINNASYHRSYWAESQNYEGGVYPTQYRPYSLEPNKFENETGYNFFQSAEENSDKYTLRYISFNEIAGQYVYTKTGDGEENLQDYPLLNGQTNHRYTVERTYDVEKLQDGDKGYSPYRQATHFLVGAKLQMGAELGGETATTKLYAYNWYWNGANAEADYVRYSYRRLASFLADGLQHRIGKVDYATTEESKKLYYAANDASAITVADAANFFEVTEAELYHGDGKVVITPKEDVTLYVKAKRNVSDAEYTFVEIPADDPEDELTALIYANTDPARYFNEGDMYYAIPVQHMHGYSNTGTDNAHRVTINKYNGYNTNLRDDETAQGGDAYTTGQFGVVRNHWYRVNILNINNVGTPVHDPDQPIIPDPEDEWAVAFEIVVLPWHVIDMGDVDL